MDMFTGTSKPVMGLLDVTPPQKNPEKCMQILHKNIEMSDGAQASWFMFMI